MLVALEDRTDVVIKSTQLRVSRTLKPADGTTLPDRLDGMQQFLSTRLEAV
jgi:hypothetical protein